MNITANFIIIAMTAIISFIAFNNEAWKNNMLFYPYLIHKEANQVYRFITHGFIHADMTHLIFNMITLYFFGENVEYYLNQHYSGFAGSGLYLLFYFAALIISSIPAYFKYRDNQYYRSLGASGAVSAMLFASILISPMSRICLFGLLCLPAYIFGPLYLIYEAYGARRGQDNIGHDAHFTGAIFGMIFIVILVPDTFSNFIQNIVNLF